MPKPETELPMERRELVFIALLLLLILSIYSLNLSKSALTPDSAGYPLVAEILHPGWMDGKPVYIWTGRLFFEFWRAFMNSREALLKTFAFYSALFGALTAINVYLIFRSLFNKRYLGGMSSVLVAFSPMFFYSAVTIESYMFNIFWATLAVLFWVKKRFIWWGIAWGLALSSHITSAFLFFPFAWSLAFSNYRFQWKKALLGCCFSIFICVVSYGWVLSFYPSLPAYIRFYRSVSQDEYLRWPTLTWITQNLIRFRVIWVVYVLIAAGGLFYFRRQPGKTLLIIVILPLLILLLYFYGSNLFLLWKSCGYVLTTLGLAAALLLSREKNRRQKSYLLFAWVVPYALFFLGWIQDGGQFYIYLVPPISLIVTRLFDSITEGLYSNVIDRSYSLLPPLLKVKGDLIIVALLFLFALSGGLFQKMGTIRWAHSKLGFPDQYALQIKSQITPGSVLIASWEGAIAKFYDPGLHVFDFPFSMVPIDSVSCHFNSSIRDYLNSGTEVFVTKNWLFQRKDAATILARETIRNEFTLLRISDDVYRIVEKERNQN